MARTGGLRIDGARDGVRRLRADGVVKLDGDRARGRARRCPGGCRDGGDRTRVQREAGRGVCRRGAAASRAASSRMMECPGATDAVCLELVAYPFGPGRAQATSIDAEGAEGHNGSWRASSVGGEQRGGGINATVWPRSCTQEGWQWSEREAEKPE